MEMYSCIDTTLPSEMEKRGKCQKEVIEKFSKFQEKWASEPAGEGKHLFVNTQKGSHVTEDQRKMIRDQCASACGAGADSSCVTECQMEMYSCIDTTLPSEMEKRGKCQKEVIEKFSKFQEKWASEPAGEGKH